MLVIKPDECIDCGVCEPECPVDAIVADTDISGDDLQLWMTVNTEYAEQWPNITAVREEDRPTDREQWDGVPNKYQEHFSPKPGKGD
jgi:ferredoxin